ncbi:MAG TPA: alpha/beta fold hydrolase [Candidatus Binatia bacterium]|nr:alpha/beta fold hydrolase [Candidatus Binatia bacterium]
MQRVDEEPIQFRSGALSLEGRLWIPAAATHAAIVCHPHPQYGGDMDNSIVAATTAALRRRGLATLRFNFRGVGRSEGRYDEGRGEVDDARAAVELLRDELRNAAIALGGYSFGAMIALLGGHDHSEVDRLFAIALPVSMFDVSPIAGSSKPKVFLLGDRDPYCPFAALEAAVSRLAGENVLRSLDGADHFLFGFEDEVGEAVARFCAPAS